MKVTLADGFVVDVPTDDPTEAATAASAVAEARANKPKTYNDKPSEDSGLKWAGRRIVSGLAKVPGDTVGAVGGIAALAEGTYNYLTGDKDAEYWKEVAKATFESGGYEAVQKHLVDVDNQIAAQMPGATAEQRKKFLEDYQDSDAYAEFVRDKKTWALETQEDWAAGVHDFVGEKRRPDQLAAADTLSELAVQAVVPTGAIGAATKAISKLPVAVRLPVRAVEAVTPLSLPYTKTNVAINAGVGAGLDTGIRAATGQPTVFEPEGDAPLIASAAQAAADNPMVASATAGAGVGAAILGAGGIAALKALTGNPRMPHMIGPRQQRLPDGSTATEIPDAQGQPVKSVIDEAPGPQYSFTDYAKASLDNTALARSERRRVQGTLTPDDVDAQLQATLGAPLHNKVMNSLRTGEIFGSGKYNFNVERGARMWQSFTPDEQSGVTRWMEARRALQVRDNLVKERQDEWYAAHQKMIANPSQRNMLEAGRARQAYIDTVDDKSDDVRVMLPQFTRKELEQAVAMPLPPKLQQYVDHVRSDIQAMLKAMHKEGIITREQRASLAEQFYYGKIWQDDFHGMSTSKFLVTRLKEGINPFVDDQSKFRMLSRGAEIDYLKPAETQVKNPVQPFETYANYMRAMTTVIYRNQLNKQVLAGTPYPVTTRQALKDGIDTTRHVIVFDGGKERIYDLKNSPGLAAMLNMAPDNIGVIEGVSGLMRVAFQRGTTGAWNPVGLVRQVYQGINSALALARPGSGVTPWTLAKGFMRANIGGISYAAAVPVQGFRKALINSATGQRLVQAFGGDPRRLDDALARVAFNMEQVLLRDMYRLGLNPESIIGHYTEAITGLRSMERELVGSKLATANPIAWAGGLVQMWTRYFEGVQSYSRVGVLMDQMKQASDRYGGADKVPVLELAKIQRIAMETEGDLIRMSSSRTLRTLQRSVPYMRTVTAGLALLGKRVRDAAGMTPGISRLDQIEALARITAFGVMPGVAGAVLMSSNPGTYNYYWNVLTPDQRTRTMFFPNNVDTLMKTLTGTYTDFKASDFYTIPVSPDFGLISGPMVEMMADMGVFGQDRRVADPTVFENMRQVLGDLVGTGVPTLVQLGAIGAGGGPLDFGAWVKGEQRGPARPMTETPSEAGNVVTQTMRDTLFAVLGTAGAMIGEAINTGTARYNAEPGKKRDKTIAALDGAMEEVLSQQTQRMPDVPLVWNGDERVMRSNTTAKQNKDDDKLLQEIGAYRTEAVGKPANPFPYGQENPLVNQIVVQLNALMSKKGSPVARINEEITRLNREIDLRQSFHERAALPASDRRKMTTTLHTRLLNAQQYKRQQLDRVMSQVFAQHDRQFRELTAARLGSELPLTLENLAAVTEQLRTGGVR